jgi:hypothetical protein
MFCATTASIVSGTLAERIKLWPFLIFTFILTALIYPIQASWKWGGGFLDSQFGFLDFAGSTVVHSVGGWAALTGAIILGPRSASTSADGSKSTRSRARTCRWPRSARSSCGSAGSASTAARSWRWARSAMRRTSRASSPTPTPRRPVAQSPR